MTMRPVALEVQKRVLNKALCPKKILQNAQTQLLGELLWFVQEALQIHRNNVLLQSVVLLDGGDTESIVGETTMFLPCCAVLEHWHALRRDKGYQFTEAKCHSQAFQFGIPRSRA